MLRRIKEAVDLRLATVAEPAVRASERQLVMQAMQMAAGNNQLAQVAQLSDVEFSAFSQWGEDGIIAWLVSRLKDIPRTFVEFGVGDYRESNTRLLLQLNNWRGAVLDGSPAHIDSIKRQPFYWRHELHAACAFIDRDNINQLIKNVGLVNEIGLLSIDVDGNDFWIWQAIDVVSPAIVVCEYNAVLGDLHELTVPYGADFVRSTAHHSHLYFGASLPAFIRLGREKGYRFVGTVSSGCNAFFVRDDVAPQVFDVLGHVRGFPSTVRESRDAQGDLTFIAGSRRMQLIQELSLFELSGQRDVRLADLDRVYSEAWAAGQWAEF